MSHGTYGGVVYDLVPDLDISHPMPFYIPVWLCDSLFCDLMITVYMTLTLLHAKSKLRNTWSTTPRQSSSSDCGSHHDDGCRHRTRARDRVPGDVVPHGAPYCWAEIRFYIISKLNANCLLATLNARLVLRSGMDKRKSVAVWEYTVSSDMPSCSGQTGSSHRTRTGNNVIQIHSWGRILWTLTGWSTSVFSTLGTLDVAWSWCRFVSDSCRIVSVSYV
ncbi:hypothetical protein OG21DRAFT_1005789 [Imleria badia]|nr:hypothetical protein OG21DRAFT_1005789 [Imleria badia]